MAKKLYNIGSVKAKTSAAALKLARRKYPKRGVSVKLFAKGHGKELSIYTVRSTTGAGFGMGR